MVDDIRLPGWDLTATAGVTVSLRFTSDTALTSLSVYTGGTLADADSLTGATQYAGTLSGGNLIATVSLVVPASTRTPLRLVVNGTVQTVGWLHPSVNGTAQPDDEITLTAGTIDLALSILGVVSTGGGGGGAVDSVNGQAGAVVLTATNIGSTATGDVAATNVQAAIAELASAKATAAALAAEAALARNGDNITSGTVADARIASTIARDSEVTAGDALKVSKAGDTMTGNLTMSGNTRVRFPDSGGLIEAYSATEEATLFAGHVSTSNLEAGNAGGSYGEFLTGSLLLGASAEVVDQANLTVLRIASGLNGGHTDKWDFRADGKALLGPAKDVNLYRGGADQLQTDDEFKALVLTAVGMTGSTDDVRLVGGTASGAPASGAHNQRDVCVTTDAHVFVCTVAGTPGTWVDVTAAALAAVAAEAALARNADNLTSGTVADARIASTIARDSEVTSAANAAQAAAEATASAALSAHTGDTSDAHDASAISISDAAGDFTADNVEDALAELQTFDESLRTVEATSDGGLTVSTATAGKYLLSMTGIDVQPFTASGTWTKPASATISFILCIGGGGGGASGRKGAAGSSRHGGGGGQGGLLSWAVIEASSLGATETVTIGPGGAGGAAVTGSDTSGTNGTAGTATTFGSHVNAGGGDRGYGGSDLGGMGGNNPWSIISGAFTGQSLMVTKRASATNHGGGYAILTGAGPAAMGGGGIGSGGAGGSIPVGNTGLAGGGGSGTPGAAAAAGGAVNTAGTAGNNGAGMTGGSGGGGGGASNAGGAAGAGGTGGTYGGGGGGGGAGVNAVANSGAGGAGGAGYCLVVTLK